MKYMKQLAAAVLALTMVCSSLSGCVFLPDEEEVLAAPKVEETDVQYSTVTAKKKDLVDQDVNTGTVCSEMTYNAVYKKQSGTISKIYVSAGDKVKKGDLLCELDSSELDYTVAETELRLKEAKLDKQILKEQGASQAELDRAQVQIDLVQMQMDDLYEQRENAKLYAGADGTISSLGSGVSAGNYIDKGVTVATIIDTSKLYIAIEPDTEDYPLYKVGTQLFVQIGENSYAAEVFMTPEEIVAQDFEEEDIKYEIYDPDADDADAPEEIEFDREHVYIRFTEIPTEDCVGNIADTVLVKDERKDVVVISNSLIKTVDGKNIVYLLQDGKKVAQEVEVGLKTGSMSEIISGVNEGDTIIVR